MNTVSKPSLPLGKGGGVGWGVYIRTSLVLSRRTFQINQTQDAGIERRLGLLPRLGRSHEALQDGRRGGAPPQQRPMLRLVQETSRRLLANDAALAAPLLCSTPAITFKARQLTGKPQDAYTYTRVFRTSAFQGVIGQQVQ